MSNFWCNFLTAFVGVGAALMGSAIGWFLRRKKIEELAEVIDTQESNLIRIKNAHETLNIRHENLQDAFNKLYASNQKLQDEFEVAMISHQTTEKEFQAEIANFENKISILNAENQALINQNDSKQEIDETKTKELEMRLQTMSRRYQDLTAEKEQLEAHIKQLNTQLSNYRNTEQADDLTKLPSVDARLSHIFQASGIHSLSQLAEMTEDELKTIMGGYNTVLQNIDLKEVTQQAIIAQKKKADETQSTEQKE